MSSQDVKAHVSARFGQLADNYVASDIHADGSDLDRLVELAGAEPGWLALDIATYRLAKYIGGYHVAVDGAQAITFTAGIGENSAPFRARVLDRGDGGGGL